MNLRGTGQAWELTGSSIENINASWAAVPASTLHTISLIHDGMTIIFEIFLNS
jgi:hypothetical protein